MYEDRGITYIETIDAITDPLYLGSPYDPWVKGAPESVCPPGMTYFGDDANGNPVCGVQTPDYNPGGTPSPLACEPGFHSIFLSDGSQTCVADGSGVTAVAPAPIPTVQNPFGGTPTTPTPGGGGILDGIVAADGTIFGFSPLVLIGIAAGAFFLMSGSKK